MLRSLLIFISVFFAFLVAGTPCSAKAKKEKSCKYKLAQIKQAFPINIQTDSEKPVEKNYIKKRFDNRNGNHKIKDATYTLPSPCGRIAFNPLFAKASFLTTAYAVTFTPLYFFLVFPQHFFW
jgi:hypothetical protein